MRKKNLVLIILAAVLLEATAALQYFMARRGVTEEVMQKANREMEESERVARVRAEVESAVRNSMGTVKEAISTPDKYYGIASRMVTVNPNIVGAGVAFLPGYYENMGKDRLYAPYAYDENPSVSSKGTKSDKPAIRTRLLPFDYTTRDWFNVPLQTNQGFWTEPYMDKGGTYIVLYTFTMAFPDSTGRNVAVFYADVPMHDLTMMANDMYSGFNASRLISLALLFLGLLALVFIVWRTMSIFRHQKNQQATLDSEKDELMEKVDKLTELNRRLTKRNLELAQKLQENGVAGI